MRTLFLKQKGIIESITCNSFKFNDILWNMEWLAGLPESILKKVAEL